MTNPIPEGHSTITPSLVVNDARAAIDLYKKALGATEGGILICPVTDKVMHAIITVGNSIIFIADVMPGGPAATASNFYLYLDDVDAAFEKACQGGMQEKYPLQDQFWGDRTGTVTDPFGIVWTLATHVKDVSNEDIERMGKEMSEKMKHQAA